METIYINSIFLIDNLYIFHQEIKQNIKEIKYKNLELNKESLERLDTDLNSIEYIHLGNYQKRFSTNYAKNDKNLKFNYAKYIVIGRLPKIIIEYIFLYY